MQMLRSNGSVASAAALPSSIPRLLKAKDSTAHLPLHHHLNHVNRFRSILQYPTLSSSSFLGSGTGISASPSFKKKPITIANASAPVPPSFPNPDEEAERAKLAQVFLHKLDAFISFWLLNDFISFHLIGRVLLRLLLGFFFFFFGCSSIPEIS